MVIGYPFIYNGIASELYDASLVFLDENYTNRPSGSEKDVVTDSIIRNAQKIWLDTTQEEVLKFGIEIVFDTPGDIHKLTTLKKWLVGSSGYAPLQICAEGFESYYYNCIIHLDEDLIYNGGYCGVSATVECDAPWAWQIENTKMYNLNVGKTNTIYFNNESDDIEMLKPILTFHMATAGTFSLNCKQFDTNHFDITNTNQTGLTKEEAIRYCRIHNISIKNITPSVYYDKTTVFSNIASDDIVQCDNQWGKITANLTTGIVQKFNKVFLKLPKGKCTLTVTGNADKMYLSYKNAKRMGVAIINFNFDAMRRYEIPEMVLCNPDKKEICMMKGLKDVQLSIKWQACCELTFTAYSSYNGIKSEYYNKIEKGRLIHVIGFGYFVIQNYDLDFDNKITTKSVTAYSAEYLLNFKDVNLVFVTTPASSTSTKVISKSYKFYDTGNPQGTLLYELMSICPQWKINYVSQSLMDKRRSFNATDDGLYGFLCNTVAESYEAVFIFDYEKYTVSAYDKDDILKDSDIILTFDNILKNCKVEELSSDTYTVLNVSGADTLSIASINPTGSKKLYKFDYYVGSLDPNSEHYYVTYNEWVEDTSLKKKVLEWQDDIKKQMYLKESDPTYKQSYGYLVKIRKIFYKLLLTQKAAYTDQKTYCEAAIQRMGIYQGSAAEIGQKNYSIQQKREAAFEANMIAIQNGGNFYKVNDDGTTEFKYVILNDIDENAPYSQIWSITALQSKIDAVDAQRDVIVSKYAFENYFTAEEVAALEPYIKEAEYSDSSFILTDTMKITDYSNGETWVETTSGVKQIKDLQSDDVIIDETYICLQLLDAGYSRFDEIYQPSFSFTADAVNFLFTDRFKDFAKKLTFGTVLNVELEDGYWVYPCFQGVDINFDDATSFSISFSNRLRLNTSEWTWADLHSDTNSAVSSTISLIGSAATPVTNGTVDKINNYMSNTLVAANQPIQATADNEFTFGSYGIRGRRVSKETTAINGYDPKQIWINNNQICFTDDAWKTTKLIIGDAGDGEYGVVADYLVGALNISDKLSFTNENRGFRVDSDDAIITNCTIENTRITSDSSGNKPHSKFSLDEIFLNNVPISTISGDYTISIDGDNGLIVKRNSTNTNIMTSNSGGMYASIFGDARAELNSGEFGYYYNNTRSLRIHNNTSGGVEAQFGISGQNCIYIRSGSSDSTLVLHNGTKTTLEANSSTGKLTVASIECTGDITVDGDLTVTGTESRVVNTSFGKIKMYSYGTPLPSFGDYGVGVCDENGECLITLDPKFSETISKTYAPVWQITPYNKGEMWIEQAENSATVHGVSGQKFSWWVCAPQNGYDNSCAEVYNNIEDTDLNNNTLDKEPLQALVCEQTKHLEDDTPNLLSEV